MDLTELRASKTVAVHVMERRNALGWSRRELAERSGLPEDAIADIELGRRKRGVTVDELMFLAVALSVGPEHLLPQTWSYLDPARKAVTEKVLAEAMTRLVTARSRREKVTTDLVEIDREIEMFRGIIEHAKQGRIAPELKG